ncbi:hypothetical protein GCM10009425_27810 [Pseudomonas asuensis]|uniref:Uncharacterized protein n=1 Tax=Pseudomonas asuensis TaxID=1825787 RepID=A0ABQ2GX88_9PSED|nr:hypothetical protein GCM10009425_27810 [Pseudomonas asuensis]
MLGERWEAIVRSSITRRTFLHHEKRLYLKGGDSCWLKREETICEAKACASRQKMASVKVGTIPEARTCLLKHNPASQKVEFRFGAKSVRRIEATAS